MAWERMSNIGRYLRILCLKSTSKKNRRKNRIIRIFCELLAKMGLGSRINRGVPEGYCRNGESPKQGIDTIRARTFFPFFPYGRNGESPKQGIDTFFFPRMSISLVTVEMEKARSRALTHPCDSAEYFRMLEVEMEKARSRALTQT